MSEEKSKAPEELELSEFLQLSESAPERKGKTTDAEVLAFISQKAKTCSDIAKNCGDVSYSAMHARLKRLKKKGKVLQRYKEGTSFWIQAPESEAASEAVAEEVSEEEVPVPE